MRLLCLVFPRLGIRVARRRNPELAGRPIVTLFGEGDQALVSDVSAEASAAGVTVGMLASVARGRCPAASFLPDNASECLDTLEQAASILRLRATPLVAIAARDHLFLDLSGLESSFSDEARTAARLAGLARTWTGFDVRAGVASTREAALAAARTARRCPAVDSAGENPAELPLPHGRDEAVRARFAWESAPGPVAARARLVRMLGALQVILDARAESFRELSLELKHSSGAAATVRLRTAAPLHRTSDVLHLLRNRVPDEVLDGVTSIELTLERLGPDVRIEPARRETRAAAVIQAPVRPVQQRLLRAG